MAFDTRLAHKSSSGHRDAVLGSDACGCFYCMSIFMPSEIVEWTDDDQTAICPRCGVDSVVGSASGWPITADFLAQMHKAWFER
jgi:hypothetical protein